MGLDVSRTGLADGDTMVVTKPKGQPGDNVVKLTEFF